MPDSELRAVIVPSGAKKWEARIEQKWAPPFPKPLWVESDARIFRNRDRAIKWARKRLAKRRAAVQREAVQPEVVA
jgi:hypothetical protein